MSFTSTLTSKNQTTIPKKVVEALQIKPSSQLHYEVEENGRVVLTAKTGTFADLAGRFPKRRISRPEMDAAIQTGAARRFKKS